MSYKQKSNAQKRRERKNKAAQNHKSNSSPAMAVDDKKNAEMDIPFLEVPRDEDDPRYIKSFDFDDNKGFTEFFDFFGFVVIHDVLSSEDSQATVAEILDIVEQESDLLFDRNDPASWHNWPTKGMERYGQIQKEPVFTPQILKNRQNPKLHYVFSVLFETEDLLVNFDRIGFMRPTKDVMVGQEVRDLPGFKTDLSLHLDLDPWGFQKPQNKKKIEDSLASLEYGRRKNQFIFENNQVHENLYGIRDGRHLQAGLNLADNLTDDGGFICIPGFYHHFSAWTKMAKDGGSDSWMISKAASRNSINFPQSHAFQKHAIRVPMREGSLVIWDQRMPHGSKPNNSSRPRFGQFLKMFPSAQMDMTRAALRRGTVHSCLKQSGFLQDGITDLGLKVFGLK